MRLYRRGKVWWASWPEGGQTVRRSTKCTTKAAAEITANRWERELADPVHAAQENATFGIEAAMFLRSCQSVVDRGKMAPETLQMYRQKAGTLVRLLGADLKLASINGLTFAEYLDTRRATYQEETATEDNPAGKVITESTLYKEWITFRGIMNHARRGKRFALDPSSLKPAHFGPEYQPRKTRLTWEQADKLLREMPKGRRGCIAYVLITGARRKEVFAAQKGDLRGARKSRTVHLRGTKTDGSDRVRPVADSLYERFGPHLEGGPPFPAWPNARRGLARACKRAGVPVVTWNDLRRTFASLLVDGGVSPSVVAKLMGHTTTRMVELSYWKPDTEALADLLRQQLKGPRS